MCVVDYARDSSDTDFVPGDDSDVEYEPVSGPEEDPPINGNSSEESDHIISTKVIEVPVSDDIQFADSECTDSYTHESDSEFDLCDYWHCAQCGAENNNPLYRYCEKCFQIRKSFFPPRPKRKKRETKTDEIPETFSQDSGVNSASQESLDNPGEGSSNPKINHTLSSNCKKRRADSADRSIPKRKRLSRTDSDTDLCSDDSKSTKIVKNLVKTISDPAVSIEVVDGSKVREETVTTDSKELCIVCISEPKSGIFIHGRIGHICCCYKCAMKVWSKTKRCPVCNSKVSNVLKAVVM